MTGSKVPRRSHEAANSAQESMNPPEPLLGVDIDQQGVADQAGPFAILRPGAKLLVRRSAWKMIGILGGIAGPVVVAIVAGLILQTISVTPESQPSSPAIPTSTQVPRTPPWINVAFPLEGKPVGRELWPNGMVELESPTQEVWPFIRSGGRYFFGPQCERAEVLGARWKGNILYVGTSDGAKGIHDFGVIVVDQSTGRRIREDCKRARGTGVIFVGGQPPHILWHPTIQLTRA
jgi:hypothetical protein